jgi:hypothetical protein
VDDGGPVRWIHVEVGAAFRAGTITDIVRVIGLVTEVDRSTSPVPSSCSFGANS